MVTIPKNRKAPKAEFLEAWVQIEDRQRKSVKLD